MSPALEVLAEAEAQGIVLTAHGVKLRGEPKSRLTPALAERLREHKTELLAILRDGTGDTTATGEVEPLGEQPEPEESVPEFDPVATIRRFAERLERVGAPAELVEAFRAAEVRVESAGGPDPDASAETRAAPTPEAIVEPQAAPAGTWDNLPEVPVPCPRCGSLEQWESLAGSWRCLRCDPPTAALRMLEAAARIRARHSKPEPPGASELRSGLKRAQPAGATRQTSHGCQ